MKIKKSLILILLCFVSMSISATDSKPLTINNLPPKAQLFIQNYFPETDFVSIEKFKKNKIYQITSEEGWKFTFAKDGSWIDIDCNNDRVPSSLVPSSILNKVAKHYGTAVKVVKITVTSRGYYYVKLSNYIKVAFDKHFNKVDFK